jgi:hypothetical protein
MPDLTRLHPARVCRISAQYDETHLRRQHEQVCQKMGKSPMNAVRDEAHFAQRNPTNPLIKFNNLDSLGTASWQFHPLVANASPKRR